MRHSTTRLARAALLLAGLGLPAAACADGRPGRAAAGFGQGVGALAAGGGPRALAGPHDPLPAMPRGAFRAPAPRYLPDFWGPGPAAGRYVPHGRCTPHRGC